MRLPYVFKQRIKFCFMAVLLTGWFIVPSPEHGLQAALDTSGPFGTWYLNANGFSLTAVIIPGSEPGTYQGLIINPTGELDGLDNISWDGSARRLEFRRNCRGCWQWYRGTVVEGVLVGRFSHSTESTVRPSQLTSYNSHVTGWNSDYLDQDIVPRVYEVLVNSNYRGRLRIDYSPDASSGYAGRLKFYATVSGGARGEELEDDLEVTQWDGTNLQFTRRSLASGWTQVYTGVATGRTISGTFTHTGIPGTSPWNGTRAEVLSYGFAGKLPDDRADWQERTRRRLYHLTMGGNPMPLTRSVTVIATDLLPIRSTRLPVNRDDDPATWPQNYFLTVLQFDYTLPNPYGGPAIPRRSHAYLAVPPLPPQGVRYPAVLAVNGHGGSAWQMMNPDSYLWYGDSFARRGFVVLAVDISHRPLADRRGLYTGSEQGDDPAHGNGPHPAVKAPGFDSDWEEDGERAWDAMRALDYLLSLPNVDAGRVLVTGLSLGGEVASIVGAMEPRLAMSVPAGYSPDMGLMLHLGHGCQFWRNADFREYIDMSDYYALTAPRPLIIETGKRDPLFSLRQPPFASDKQVARRTRAAYGDEVYNFIHYLHYDEHAFHVGDANPACSTCERGVYVPNLIEPEAPWSLGWQSDGRTSTDGFTLFDYIGFYLGY